MHNCTQCTYSTSRKGNLQRHLETKHKERGGVRQKGKTRPNHETELFLPSEQHNTDLISKQCNIRKKELKQATLSQQQQDEEAIKNYEDYIQKLENDLQCQQKRNDDEVRQLLKYQQHKYNQELREQQWTLQKQFNIKITNIQCNA